MNKLIIIGASIAGILGTMDIITTDPLKYGACALLGITVFMTLNELNPQKEQGQQRQVNTRQTVREEPKDIWDMFPKEAGTKEEVKPKEVKKEVETKKPTFKIEDTINEEQNKIQDPEEVQKIG